MKAMTVFIAIYCLMFGAAANAVDCTNVSSQIEAAVCHNPELVQLDARLNDVYAGLRPKLTSTAQRTLGAQQRRWLSDRSRLCTGRDAVCLQRIYNLRLDQLQALDATAAASSNKLKDVTPVIVKGTWKVTSLYDPAGAGKLDQADLVEALQVARLPSIGSVISSGPGKLCFNQEPCNPMGWTQLHLSNTVAGWAIERDLKLDSKLKVLEGSSGSRFSYYQLVPREDGTVWALVAISCQTSSNCRNAAEVWAPASSDAAVLIGTQAFVLAR